MAILTSKTTLKNGDALDANVINDTTETALAAITKSNAVESDNKTYKTNLTNQQTAFESKTNAAVTEAKNTANNALSVANGIDAKASSALTQSSQAVTKANSAESIANEALNTVVKSAGTSVKLGGVIQKEWEVNSLENKYALKQNPTVGGAIKLTDANSQITRTSISPQNNNIGVNGVMLTHFNGDEGGLLINEDGAYLWNSTDSGSALKIIDEDLWTGASLKKDATFSTGLLLNLDSTGNLLLKGSIKPNGGVALNAADISITPNTNLGNATTLQAALNYIANVFAGVQSVAKLKAKIFDAQE